jgi:hypothetical protein
MKRDLYYLKANAYLAKSKIYSARCSKQLKIDGTVETAKYKAYYKKWQYYMLKALEYIEKMAELNSNVAQ